LTHFIEFSYVEIFSVYFSGAS